MSRSTLVRCLRARPLVPWWLAALALVAYLLLVLNHAMWATLWPLFATGEAGGLPFLAAITVVIGAYLYLLFVLILWPHVGKPLAMLLLVVSAAVAYFMDAYGITVDRDMIRNVVETNGSEARDLLTAALCWHVAGFGVLPALLLWRLRIGYPRWTRLLLHKGVAVLAVLALVAVAGRYGPFAKDFTFFNRNHRDVRGRINPLNYISASVRYGKRQWDNRDLPLVVIGQDARLAAGEGTAAAAQKVVVLVVGEASRAENYGLQGYARDTTPRLRAAGVDYFTDARSCGTATTISVPCMFSREDRKHFDEDSARHTENVLDVLQRAGVDVLWRDNDDGCKDVCDRVPHEDFSTAQDPAWCTDADCLDGILLQGLSQKLRDLPRPLLVVLHLKGSHGPGYAKRYPPALRRFTPTCETREIQTCSHQQIINTYDNSILYTDHVLGQVIDLLQALPEGAETALMYLSDHGESLGENGIYLHGTPYAVAPSEQTHIPFLLWFSPAWRAASPRQAACVASRVHEPVSQDNLFDTLLGLFGARTRVYDAALDLGAGCTAGTAH